MARWNSFLKAIGAIPVIPAGSDTNDVVIKSTTKSKFMIQEKPEGDIQKVSRKLDSIISMIDKLQQTTSLKRDSVIVEGKRRK